MDGELPEDEELSETDRSQHELRCIGEVPELGVCYDQLDVASLVSLEYFAAMVTITKEFLLRLSIIGFKMKEHAEVVSAQHKSRGLRSRKLTPKVMASPKAGGEWWLGCIFLGV